jgi:outer membrane protein assembly factor BamB
VTDLNWSRRTVLSTLAVTTFGGCVGRSGDKSDENSGNNEEKTLSTFWEYQLPGRAGTLSVDDETAFVAGTTYEDGDDGSTGHVLALDRTNGQRQWQVEDVGEGIPFGPYLTDSILVVVNDAGTVFGIDVNDQERRWSTSVTATPTTRPFAGQNTLYVGYDDGLRVVNPATGDVETTFETEYGIDFAAGANRAYVGSHRPTSGETVVQAVGDGGATWKRRFDTTDVGGIVPTVDRVFVTAGRKLVALSPDSGETLWSTAVGPTVGEPAVTGGSVHVATRDGIGAYLRENGDERWTAAIDGGAATSFAVGKEYLFVGADGEIRAFAADTGDPVGKANFKDGRLTTRPTISENRAFVGNFEERSTGYDGRIYSFDVAPK